jgi:Leucine-rich repeat (LRR) protein
VSLRRLTRLEDVAVSDNNLRSAPDGLEMLVELKKLSLEANEIASLPSLRRLTKLNELWV